VRLFRYDDKRERIAPFLIGVAEGNPGESKTQKSKCKMTEQEKVKNQNAK